MRVASLPGKPLLIYDGDCGFCRRWIMRWQASTGDRVDYLPAQETAARFPEIDPATFAESVVLIEPDGSVHTGAAAVFRSRGRGQLYERVPGLAPVSEWAYRLVSRNRRLFSRLMPVPREYVLSREIFLRGLGLIYLFAFVSLWTQAAGLFGPEGIAPVAQWREVYAAPHFDHNGYGAYLMSPTVFWFGASETMLTGVFVAGVALAGCVVAGVAMGPALLGLWALYLSLMHVGNVFLGFQWDALLLEVGFLAMWWAPWRLRPGALRETRPSLLVRWMLWWLLFRLMLAAGAVKLASGDVLWSSLTALGVHYQTQPLPTWLAWYAHQLPAGVQQFCCGAMFVIELALPFFVFGPRRLRLIAAGGFTLLMGLIALTGNYCFFNLLTVLLCVTLLDDTALRSLWRWRTVEKSWPPAAVTAGGGRRNWRTWLFAPVAAVIVVVSVPGLLQSCGVRVRWASWFVTVQYTVKSWVWPLHSVNNYGLFAVMTPRRPEIVVEGSRDGQTWQAYEFKYKPGDPGRRPRFNWPHQPRLDWQMWFAALGNVQGNPWFLNFCGRLLEGKRDVVELLATNPFPDAPPRFVRAQVYEYRFTTPAERRASGAWWHRELQGLWCPPVSLKQSS